MLWKRHKHTFTDWSITETGRVMNKLGHIQIGTYLVQSRFCPGCGRTQLECQSTVRLMPGSYSLVPESKKTVAKHDSVSTR